jgi:hypothetical protein
MRRMPVVEVGVEVLGVVVGIRRGMVRLRLREVCCRLVTATTLSCGSKLARRRMGLAVE